ncbi:MAG TPA: septum formation initiator family protein [Acidimicrobiales bacterium]|nr:septum formation initiator family protein [Acidimicrobiales bacterium]
MRRLLWPLVGGAILVVFLVAGVFPTRTYLHQRDAIAAEETKVAVLSAENSKLAAKVDRLHTDAEIERLAREQYNLVRPGEEAYAILPGPADPQPETTTPAPPPVRLEPPEPSWWQRATDALTFWD